jgi:transposase
MSRERVLTDAQWERIAPLMPSSDGVKSRPVRDHRHVVEAVIYRFRTGIAWRDLPASFGPWRTVLKRHHRFSTDGTWDKIHARLLAEVDAAGEIDWMVSVVSRSRLAGAPRPSPGAESSYTNLPRICATSRLTMRSAARAGGCRPRSTSSSTDAAAPW